MTVSAMFFLSKKIKLFIGLIVVFVLLTPFASKAASSQELREGLEAQIKELQRQINDYQGQIKGTQQKSRTLENEIKLSEDRIQEIKLEIKQIDLSIQESALNIQETNKEISGLEDQIDEKKVLLSEYIRVIAESDQKNLLEIILQKENFSDFFEEVNALENAQEKIQDILAIVQELKSEAEEHREEMEDELTNQYQLRSLQAIQRRSAENQQKQKENFLKQTKGEEERYQALIKEAEKGIGYIREQISLLDKYHLTLEEAVQNAIFAATKTGIRPAFLLGVLEAESRLGMNVGTGNWQKDMYQCYRELGYKTKAEQQKNAFFQICQELGLNPDSQPVSAEPWYGCGGAMGIAQFMPATWLAYKERIAAMTRHNPPSPWNNLDGFAAAAVKLADAGATQRDEQGERMAYGKYLGGNNWQKWTKSKVTDYVIQLTANFQQEYFK